MTEIVSTQVAQWQHGTAAGVPFVAVPPPGGARPDTPAVLAWHLMAPPCSERAFAAAVPMSGVDAWRIYLGVPMCGTRLPTGGQDELMRRVVADAVRNVYGPVTAQAVDEFPAAYAHLRDRFDLAEAPAALVGGSAGGAVAARVAVECTTQLSALVLINALVQVRPGVEAMANRAGVPYVWSPQTDAIADRLDFAARAGEIAALGEPAVLLVVGEEDLLDGFREPAQRLHSALRAQYRDPSRARLELVPAMGHAFADEPGFEPAAQTLAAAAVDRHVTAWLQRHLTGPAA